MQNLSSQWGDADCTHRTFQFADEASYAVANILDLHLVGIWIYPQDIRRAEVNTCCTSFEANLLVGFFNQRRFLLRLVDI